jgi:hypothetical protein
MRSRWKTIFLRSWNTNSPESIEVGTRLVVSVQYILLNADTIASREYPTEVYVVVISTSQFRGVADLCRVSPPPHTSIDSLSTQAFLVFNPL